MKSHRFLTSYLQSRQIASLSKRSPLDYTHPLDRRLVVSKQDIADLEAVETGGRLELQHWMNMEKDDIKDDIVSSKNKMRIRHDSNHNGYSKEDIDELIAQGYVCVWWKKLV
jgi:hypothetical protein